nr:DUF4160 domain-containing protein [Jiella mangrovi]
MFYSKEIGEPPHIHILKDGKQLKVWLKDMRLARNAGFSAREVNAIMKIVAKNNDSFLEAWNDHFGN